MTSALLPKIVDRPPTPFVCWHDIWALTPAINFLLFFSQFPKNLATRCFAISSKLHYDNF